MTNYPLSVVNQQKPSSLMWEGWMEVTPGLGRDAGRAIYQNVICNSGGALTAGLGALHDDHPHQTSPIKGEAFSPAQRRGEGNTQ